MDELLVNPEGLRELVVALRVLEPGLAVELTEGLREGGRIVQEQARKDFINRKTTHRSAGSASVQLAGDRKTAQGFRTYVRAATAVNVEQSLRKTTGLHPEYGALQMTQGLLPAREEKSDEVAERIELGVGGLLRKHGF